MVLKTTTKKLRSPLKWHGGKSYLARRIVALMPEHRTYVEPFLGGGSVILNKPKAEREVAGDLNAGLTNFWLTLRDDPLFRTRVDLTPYDRGFFDKAMEHSESDGAIVRAWCFLVRNRFSRGGLGKDFAWSDRIRGGQPGDVNAWETIKEELPAIAERMRDVEFHCCDALQLIRTNDGPDTLHYLDPPYLHETRTHRKAYVHEMSRVEHANLLHLLSGLRGTFVLSGYPSKLYDDTATLCRWHRVEFDMPNHSGQGKNKQRRTECLWSNRPFPKEAP
jgi:DNA adenine methylase